MRVRCAGLFFFSFLSLSEAGLGVRAKFESKQQKRKEKGRAPSAREAFIVKVFDNASVSYPLCCPSRASILRGQYPHNTEVLGNLPPEGGYKAFRRLKRETSTIATWLQGGGCIERTAPEDLATRLTGLKACTGQDCRTAEDAPIEELQP